MKEIVYEEGWFVLSDIDPLKLFPIFNRASRRSCLLNLIGSLLDRKEQVASIVQRASKHLSKMD